MLTYCLKCMKLLDLLIVLAVHLLKINKEFKDLWRLEIQNTFTKMNWTKPAFNMIWLMEIIKT